MAGTLRFELTTPERVVLSGEASEVVIPGLEGVFTVLPGHAPVIAQLRPGMVEVAFADAKRALFVKGGIAELDGEHVTVLAERALDVEALDGQAIAAEIKAAEEELAAAADDTGRLAASAALQFFSAMRR